MYEDMADAWLQARMQCRPDCWIRATVQVVIKTLSVLSRSFGLGTFRTPHWPYFLYKEKLAMIQVP